MVAPRTLVIGLDAFDRDLTMKLIADGKLPALAGLLDRGAHAGTIPPVGLYEGALWPTMFTGRSAENHGFYCHEELVPGTYKHRDTSPREVDGTPFWRVLGDEGLRVGVIDVPHALAAPVNGIEISEWGNHDRHEGFRTWPPELADEVRNSVGLHPVAGLEDGVARNFAPCDHAERASGPTRTHDEARTLFDALQLGVERKKQLALELLGRDDWDLFITVFGEGHCTGHQFWFLHESDDPRYDAPLHDELGDPVVQIYEQVDAAVGQILDRVGDDTTVFVFLSHGMGQMNSGVFLIDAVLHRLAHGRPTSDAADPPKALVAVWKQLPASVRRRLAPIVAASIRRKLRKHPELLAENQEIFDRCEGCSSPRDAGANGQPWFVVPNNTVCGGIRMNLVGREPNGVIDPESFDTASRELAADLLDVIKVESGEPLVEHTELMSDHYERAEGDAFPDLFATWSRRLVTTTVWSPKTGLVHEPYEHWRTGDHFPKGLLIVAGPGIEPVALPDVSVADIAPTICATFGVELKGVDGHPIDALIQTRAPIR